MNQLNNNLILKRPRIMRLTHSFFFETNLYTATRNAMSTMFVANGSWFLSAFKLIFLSSLDSFFLPPPPLLPLLPIGIPGRELLANSFTALLQSIFTAFKSIKLFILFSFEFVCVLPVVLVVNLSFELSIGFLLNKISVKLLLLLLKTI